MNTAPKPTEAEKSKAYTAAQRRLREAHQEEFYSLLQTEYAAIGWEWSPPKTAEQKAQEAISAALDQLPADQAKAAVLGLLEAHPELAGKLLPASEGGLNAAVEVDRAIAAEAEAAREAEAATDAPAPRPAKKTAASKRAPLDDAEIPEGTDPWASVPVLESEG